MTGLNKPKSLYPGVIETSFLGGLVSVKEESFCFHCLTTIRVRGQSPNPGKCGVKGNGDRLIEDLMDIQFLNRASTLSHPGSSHF